MALVVNTNVASIQAQYNLSKTNQSMQDSMAALSSGKRINTAGDDAAGLSIATRMEAQVRGLSQAIRNAQDGISLVDTAEGAMDEINSMLQRMRELAIQSSNATLNSNDRSNLDAEFSQLKTEIDRVVDNTRFNDTVLLNGSFSGKDLQIGAKSNETLTFGVSDLSTTSLGTSLSGISDAALSTSVVAKGTEAIANVVNMTFNGNDTYGFTVEFADGGAAKTITIANIEMVANDAEALANEVQNEIDGNANLRGLATAAVTGNTVTISALDGEQIEIASFTSEGGGSATVNPVTDASASSVVLEDVSEAASLTNSGGTAATASTASLQLESGKAYSFKVNGTLIEVATGDDTDAEAAVIGAAIKSAIEATSDGTITVTATGSETHAGEMRFDISDSSGARIDMTAFQKITSAEIPDGAITFENVGDGTDTGVTATIADGAAITGAAALQVEDGSTAKINFSNTDLAYGFTFGGTAYTVSGTSGNFQSNLTALAQQITNDNTGVTAANVNGLLEISNTSGAAVAFSGNVSAPGVAAVDEGDAFFLADALSGDLALDGSAVTLADGSVGQSVDGIVAVPSQMFLEFSANDRYTFTVDGDGAGADANQAKVIVADVTDGSLAGVINSINAQSSSTNITAREQSGQVVLTKADGTTFSVTNFSSEGTGKITAVNAGGQGGSAVLENSGDGDGVVIAESQVAVATTLELSFSGTDKYSFKISDGSSVATVRATDVTEDGSNDGINVNAESTDLKDEIDRALLAANMDHITSSISAGVITLSNALGTKIEISDYASDGTGVMTSTPGANQGVGKLLNDDSLNNAEASVSAMSLGSISASQSAIDAIDRAIENVTEERSKLGAISNRLAYTVSNLGNVEANTMASRGRIEDADFAAESANLAKNQILLQAGTAMLAQANASQQTVLSLLG
jgi:flagellin